MCDGTDKRKWKGSRFSGARDHFDRMCDRFFLHEPDRGRDRDTGDRIRKQGTPGSEERDRDRRLRVRHRRPVHVCAVICQLQLLYDLCQPGNQLLLLVGL